MKICVLSQEQLKTFIEIRDDHKYGKSFEYTHFAGPFPPINNTPSCSTTPENIKMMELYYKVKNADLVVVDWDGKNFRVFKDWGICTVVEDTRGRVPNVWNHGDLIKKEELVEQYFEEFL